MNTKKTPLAVAVFVEIIYLICLLFVALFPNFSQTVFQSWMHGIDLTAVWNPAVFLSTGSIVLGIVSIFVIIYLLIWLFVVVYQKIAK